MPKKAERRVPLPAGLIPLLSQKELETYYGVSDWTVLQWIEAGMPVEPFGARGRRFDLTEVKTWMTKQAELLAASACPAKNVPPISPAAPGVGNQT